MTSIKKGLLWAFIAFGVEATFANEVLNLNEELLKSIVVNSEAPDLIQLEANLTETKARLGEFDDQYSIRAQAESLYAKTYEEPFISFQPIYSPRKAFSVGLAKKTSKGIELSSQVYTDKREYEFSGVDTINSIAGAQVRINLDLWKNIFGRLEASQKKGLKYSVETTKLSNQVQKQVFLNSLRIIYWQIIAKEHSLDIAGELLKTAEKQRDQAIQRLRSSVSDKGEVARYKAQVSSRKNQINILQFEKEQLFQRLRDMIPSFNGMTFVINKPSFDKTIGTVLQCVSYLKTLEETPFEFSSYDEINQSLEKFYNEQIKVSKRYDDVDLKLTSVFNTNGVEPRAQDALDESFKENRAGFEVGLRLDIPFGNLDETGAQKVKIEKMKLRYQKLQNTNRLTSEHQFIRQSVDLLLTSVTNQLDNIKNLRIRLSELQKKYRQGRISVSELILDQDNLLQSELGVIDTRLLIISTLINYFSVFTSTPCEFNRILK